MIVSEARALTDSALDVLMPLHLRVAPSGHIAHCGPTLTKIRHGKSLIGSRFLEVFSLRRPRKVTKMAELRQHASTRLHLQFRETPTTAFKGVLVPFGDDGTCLINLAFGISFVEALRDYNLNSADFAPTDLTIEMLYLLEAKSAVMDESRRLNARLQAARIAAEEQAFTDTLTGLKNRRAMDHVLARFVERRTPFAIIHLDLDYFKAVNDTLGHAAGDHVLQEVAQRLIQETREHDTVVRAGGDEFLLILPLLTADEPLVKLAERVIARLEKPIPYEGNDCNISASAGITVSEWYDAPDVDTMLGDADASLYASKREGRGRVTLCRPGENDAEA